MGLKTFKTGGIHPEDSKLSKDAAIAVLPIPTEVFIPVSQHIGKTADICVKKGDEVKVGTRIANADGFVSANIHSSLSGKVKKIDELMTASGYKSSVIIIEADENGGNTFENGIVNDDKLDEDIKLLPDEIKQRILDAGIVGLGGAAFPTHIKLAVLNGKSAELLIINGVECEPYLTSDYRIMMEKTAEILVGAKILMTALGVTKCVVGVENNKPIAIKLLNDALNSLNHKYEQISIEALKVQYPQGGEKQLIQAVTGKEVPSGGLPIDVGCVVSNVSTAFAVYEAVQKNKPLVERTVTITGDSVKQPSNFLVRIGTPVSKLIDAAGGLPDNIGKIINGGPMMGKTLSSEDVPVVKGMGGITLMPEDKSHRVEEHPCIRCGKCAEACPVNLAPYYLSEMVKQKRNDEARKHNLMDCIECGCCQYTCPSGIPLLDNIRAGKKL
ncbi:MAG: electron transport complex subunit RsxC [Alphaproteobacteria bacterium]|nr:electron transport complex subunit RsxC [Alphaproteobacteria bacterium]